MAEIVLDAIRDRVEETQLQEPISKWYFLNYSEGILGNDEWEEIDSILLDIM